MLWTRNVSYDTFRRLKDSGIIFKSGKNGKWIANPIYITEQMKLDARKRYDDSISAEKIKKKVMRKKKLKERPTDGGNPNRSHPIDEIKYYEPQICDWRKPFDDATFKTLKENGDIEYWDRDYLESVVSGITIPSPRVHLKLTPQSAYILEKAGIKTGTKEQFDIMSGAGG